jgi:4-amino-4-deoxy-L-arabinose transferase-like glycosyltransferase
MALLPSPDSQRAAPATHAEPPSLRAMAILTPLLVLLATWIPGAAQGWYRTDSHYYAGIALQAWSGTWHDFFHLRAGETIYLNKPPLVFWIHGLFLRTLGTDVWVGRLPSLLAALGCVLFLTLLIRNWINWRAALFAGIILATSMEFFRYTKAISLDLWMTLFMLAAVASVARALRTDRPKLLIAAGIFTGLGLLCKPFVALLALLLALAWGLTTINKSKRSSLTLWSLASIFSAIAIALPWHIAMHHTYGTLFTNIYITQQSLERASESSEPWYYYFQHALAEGFIPWVIVFVGAILWLVARKFRPLPNHAKHILFFWMLWLIIWLLALALFGGKSTRYSIPLFPALAAICAIYLTSEFTGSKFQRVTHLAATWLGPIAIFCATIIALLPLTIHKPQDPIWKDLTKKQASGTLIITSPSAWPWGSHTYLLGGTWAKPIEPPTDPTFASPFSVEQPHNIILLTTSSDTRYQAVATLIAKGDGYRAWQVSHTWPQLSAALASSPSLPPNTQPSNRASP